MDVQNFDRSVLFFGRNGQKEFQIPLADRADEVLPLVVPFFLFFTSFKSYDFLKFVKNIPIANNKTFIMLFIEVFLTYVGRA